MKTLNRLAVFGCALLLSAGHVGTAAAVVVVVEPPDFSDTADGNPLKEINLQPGFNSLIGSASVDDDEEGRHTDLDDVLLIVPTNYQIEGISFAWDFTPGAGVTSATTSYMIGSETFNVDLMSASSPLVNMFTLPLTAGVYTLNHVAIDILKGTLAATGIYTYEWRFKVAPVPLPAAAWLLVSGLLGFAAIRRRRAQTA